MQNSKLQFKIQNYKELKDESEKSFTLIEMLVYLAVLAILSLVISSFVLFSIRSNTKAKVMKETLNNSRRAMEIITYEIREAKSIYTPTSSPTQLSLETTKYLPEEETFTYLDFYLCQKRLCLKKESQNPIALTSERVEINKLEFTPIGTTSIQIELKVDYKNEANKAEYQATVNLISTASLRSY